MSGCGVTEIPSIMSHEFHPQGVGDRAPSARACCKSRQIKRRCLWVAGRNLLEVARCCRHKLSDVRDAPSSKATAGRQDAGPARGRGLASAPRRRPRRRLSEPSVLRPARPRAGQVRDAAPPPGRWTAGDRGRGALRGQPAARRSTRPRPRSRRTASPGWCPSVPGRRGPTNAPTRLSTTSNAGAQAKTCNRTNR